MQTDWKSTLRGYEDYLALEKGLSKNSIDAYKRDVRQFAEFLLDYCDDPPPNKIQTQHVEKFIGHMYDLGLSSNTQARIISGVRSFCKFMRIEKLMNYDPLELISTPKLKRKLPDILTVDDIESIISSVDMSKKEGVRNRAILEVLYSCGLRVSELVKLQMSRVDLIDSIVSVIGKGNKERVVPIGSQASEAINDYLAQYRSNLERLIKAMKTSYF